MKISDRKAKHVLMTKFKEDRIDYIRKGKTTQKCLEALEYLIAV